MTIFYGNHTSKIICFFFHGWTSSPAETLESIKHMLNKNYLWILPKAPIKKNQWFEYGNIVPYDNNNDLDQLMLKYNLNYKDKNHIFYSIEYIDKLITKNLSNQKDIYMFGSSQGATILFHYICTYEKKLKNLQGVWFHNMAGFYTDLMPQNATFLKKFETHTDSYSMRYDKHSVFDHFVAKSMNSIFENKNVVFYNTLSDKVIPIDITNKYIELLRSIYYGNR